MPARPYDVRQVANYLLDLGDSEGFPLTQVSLYKIIYFCYGWYLITTGTRLFKNSFEAWEYGPVVRVLRDEFKSFGRNNITGRATKLDLASGERDFADPSLDEYDKKFVSQIFTTYRVYDAWELSDMTHEPGSPWDKLWNARGSVARLGLRIYDEEIKNHFTMIASRNRVS